MGLGKKIGLAAVVAIVAIHVPCLACEMKHGQHANAAEAAIRKPAKVVEAERVRVEHRDTLNYYIPIPSRRIILQ